MLNEVNTATESGRIAGQIFVWIALLAGALKCWSISRRPSTNTKCALSLMVVLIAFTIACCAVTIAKVLGPSPLLAVVSGFLGLVMIGLIITAIILAILGLVEFSNRRDAYTQGRAQAIWALGLTGLICIFALTGFIKAMQRSYDSSLAAGHSQPGKILTFDEFNFQFRSPDRPWMPFDASKINKVSKLSFMRRFPDAYFFLIPEKIGPKARFTTEQLADIGKANMQAVATSSRVVSESPLQVGGLSGLLVELEAQVGSYQLHYHNWYCFTNGYAYQLVAYSRSEDQQQVAQELRDMFSRFTLIDPNRMATMSGGFSTNFYSPGNHYAVILTNSAWHLFPSLDKKLPAAEFGASQGDSCFAVMPVRLNGLSISGDALASALLSTMNVTYPNEDLTNRRLLSEGKLHGEQFDFARDIDGITFHYRFKILQDNEQGYLIAAWTQRRADDTESVLSDVFARVKFQLPSNTITVLSSDQKPFYQERKAQGYILNQAGLYYSKEGEFEKALPLFCAAMADNQNSFYVGNALDTWKQLDRPKDALAFLDQLSTNQLALPDMRANRAFFQARASFTDQAASNYASLFTTGYRNDSHLSEYINLLVEQKQYDTALSAVQSYLQAKDSVTARLLEAEIYREKQNLPKAISLLQALHEQAPLNTPTASALAETYLTAGRYSESLEISKNLVNNGGSTAYAEYLKGRSELGLKWYREAKISLAEAVKLAPANKNIRSYLDYVSGLLGEGDNTAIMDPIDPVALPTALTNAPTGTVPADYAASYGAYYIRRIVATDYQPGKESRTTEFMLVKILDASGVSAFSTVQIAFDPLGEQVFVNDVHVMDADGKTISADNLSNYYVLDDRSTGAASQKKILNIPVSGLQPGCQLAVTFTRRQQGRLEGFPFCAHSFSCTVPVCESIFFLSDGGQGLKYHASPALEPQKLPEGLCWRVADPLVAHWEPLQPPAADFLPMLWISDGSAQWRALTTNYLASISDRLELDPARQNLTRKLTEKLDNNELKIGVLASYVQTNLTYKAIEFGRRARIPNKPADIIRNKYGDCKDHAVLLQQMLTAAGVPAQLALVSHHGSVQKDQPSLDQFDHMIVYVPNSGDGLFLDCTSKGSDVAHAIPYGLAGREAMILDARDPRFVVIPRYPDDASTISVAQHLRVVNQADLSVDESLTLTGVHAAFMRDYLTQISESSRQTTLQNMMEMGDADLTDFKINSLTETAEPLRLHFTYSLQKQFHRSGDQLRGIMRAGFARSYLTASPVDNRLTPFEVTIPISIEAKMFIDVPDGFKADQPVNPDLKLNPQFAIGQSVSRIEGGQLILDFKCRQLTGKFKAADYAPYRQTMAQALSFLEREVDFKADKP
jgi:hypothetical protein